MRILTQWHLRSKRKPTGALLKKRSKKKRYQVGRDFLPAHVGQVKKKTVRTIGGGRKTLLLSTDLANVSIAGKIKKTKILTVKENPADSQFVRRNIITRGAIIETELGLARVTSRPGQHGVVNAVLVEKKG